MAAKKKEDPLFEEVYQRYFKDVYRYLLSLTRNESLAEELTQETFFKALRKIDSYKGESRLYTWLCSIARNVYIDHTRRREEAADPLLGQISDDSDLEEKLADREAAYAIHRVLHQLQEPYKEVFWLRTFGELSFVRIGELFEKSESWARVTYYRAKVKIKEEIK